MVTNWDERTKAHQAVRIRRLWMSIGSYGCTFAVGLACCLLGLVPTQNLVIYAGSVLVINALFAVCFYTGLNLRWRDPNLSMEQMLLSVIPALYLMYWVEGAQARGAFLMLAIVPLLYGVLGLDTRRFLIVGLLNIAGYVALMALILMYRPAYIDRKGDLIQFVALMGTLIQVALIGGYIYGLRAKLNQKTDALNQALAKISDMANHDELTGVCNRRFLMRFMEHEVARCDRGVVPFSIALIDLDFFKQINDKHGHSAGDEVLKTLANAVNSKVRQVDCFGRYGGEEFLLVLSQTSLANARLKVERLRGEVTQLRYEGLPADHPVTISCGVAEFKPGESVAQLIARADAALYRAKEAGRNRVVCDPDEDAAVPQS